MYRVGADDRVFGVEEAPPPSGGSAMARIVADEGSVVLAYVVAESHEASAMPDAATTDPVAVCRFGGVRASYFGSPNDEALASHPLYERGLSFYGVFRVSPSSWINELERYWNASPAHPAHPRPGTHFIVTMHDRTFECIAQSLSFEMSDGTTAEAAAHALAEFGRG